MTVGLKDSVTNTMMGDGYLLKNSLKIILKIEAYGLKKENPEIVGMNDVL
jgi:hypothetical protein